MNYGQIYKTITYIAGGLTMIGSLVPIIVNYQRTGLDEDKKLDKTYVQLIKFKVEARRNQSQLKFFMDHNFNVDGISEVINRCNELCAEMEELLLLS